MEIDLPRRGRRRGGAGARRGLGRHRRGTGCPAVPGCATGSQLPPGMTTLTAAQARRIAVAAQGFAEPKPRGPVTRAHLRRLISRIQVLQLDSVSVAVRAHYAPVFSRLGPYDRDVLDRAAWSHCARSPRLLVEYWAHEAALMAVDDWPLLRWRMREYTHGRWGTEIVKNNPRLADDIVAAVAELGPVDRRPDRGAPRVAEPRGSEGPVVGPQRHQVGGRGAVRRRGADDGDPGRLRPALRPDRARAAARGAGARGRRRRGAPRADAAGGHGAGRRHRGRHSRLLPAGARAGQAGARRAGAPMASSNGSRSTAGRRRRICVPGQIIPRRDRGTALLCPFDPLIFFRPRVERLFDFHYRIEIYTPAPKRQFGYYVWPFLLDGQPRRPRRPEGRRAPVTRCMSSVRSPNRVSSRRA